jgi:hypothetical protein
VADINRNARPTSSESALVEALIPRAGLIVAYGAPK